MVLCKEASVSQLPFSFLYFSIFLIRLGTTFLQRSSSNTRLSSPIRACFSRYARKLREVCKRTNGVTFNWLLRIHSFFKHYLHGLQSPDFAMMNKVECLPLRSSIAWGKRHYQVKHTIQINIKYQIYVTHYILGSACCTLTPKNKPMRLDPIIIPILNMK